MTADTLLERFNRGDARERLLAFMDRQRWFASRGADAQGLSVTDVVPVREGDALGVWMLLVEVRKGETSDLYNVPLTRRPLDEAVVREADHPALVDTGEENGVPVVTYDAMADAASVEVLWQAIEDGETHRGVHGAVRFTSLSPHRRDDLEAAPPSADQGQRRVTVRPLGKEQSNSAAVLGEREMLKCLRRVQRGVNPELEMTRALGSAGFAAIATPLGAVTYRGKEEGDEQDEILLALVQPYLHNGTEGFALALTSLRVLYADAEEHAGADAGAREQAAREQGATFVPEAIRIGEVTAAMHLALSGDGLDEAMRPRPVGRDALARWAGEFTAELDRLLHRGDPVLAPLRERRDAVAAVYGGLNDLEGGGLSIRVHGDLHLGQLLRTDAGWTVLDFEGEPARPLGERRQHSSPLNDVAGLLRSFDYAAAVALADRCSPGDRGWDELLEWGHAWSRANRQAMWHAYLTGLAGSPLLPVGDGAVVLRRAFELRKAVYEVGYELDHRPDWAAIPLRFLTTLGDVR